MVILAKYAVALDTRDPDPFKGSLLRGRKLFLFRLFDHLKTKDKLDHIWITFYKIYAMKTSPKKSAKF